MASWALYLWGMKRPYNSSMLTDFPSFSSSKNRVLTYISKAVANNTITCWAKVDSKRKPALPFNDSVGLVFDYGFHPVLLFAEAVGLLAKIPGFLPRDWRIG